MFMGGLFAGEDGKDVYPCEGLLNGDDERVKCVLGLMAYRKLIQLKETV